MNELSIFNDFLIPTKTFRTNFLTDLLNRNEARSFKENAKLKETEQKYIFEFDLPGFEKDEVDVSISDNVLIITAEHKQENKNKFYFERESKDISFVMPENINSEKIEANLKNGVLNVEVEKKLVDTKKININ